MADVTPELLLQAYRAGIFPMAEHKGDPDIYWVDPKRRGVFPLDGFHISRSLARTLRSDSYRVTKNADFAGVMAGCANRRETWISADIRRLYLSLHASGHAHSVEVWHGTELAGGVYGVTLGAAYFGESMFSTRRDASKIALAWLVDLLRRGGFRLFDTQFLTPHLASLGAVEISRDMYLDLLDLALAHSANFAATPLALSGHDVVQRNVQTS